jgi:hypothetical protein
MLITDWTDLKTQFIRKFPIELQKQTLTLTRHKNGWPVSWLSVNILLELQNAFDMECETRIEREKDIMQAVDDAKYGL